MKGMVGKRALGESRKPEQDRTEAFLSQHLQTILSTAHDGFWMVDTQGRFLEVNASACAMTGYSREEMLAMSLHDLAAGQTEEEMAARLRHIREQGSAAFESRFRRKDGRLVEIEFSVNFLDEEGGRFFAFIRDLTERKRAEGLLRESETRFRALANGIAQLAWMARPDGYIFWFNRRAYEYTGATPEQLEGWAWEGFQDPQVLPEVLQEWRRLLATGEPYDMKFPLRGADGRFRLFLTRVMPLKDPQGRVLLWFGTHTDISELQEAQEALRQSEARFRTLIEKAPAAISINRNGVALYVNQKYVEMFGARNAEEFVGRPASEHWGPETQAILAERVRECSLGLPGPATFEGVAHRSDGSRFPAHVATRVVNLADGPASLAFITDITERKQAEQANARLAAIVESSEDSIISKTLDGCILTWNRGAEKLFGYTAREAVGQNMRFIIPPDRTHEEEDFLARIARGETVEAFETVRLTKSGRLIPVSVTISPIRNAAGQITGASTIARDITERKQAQEALRCARDELARANADLERKVAERTDQLAEANANLQTFAHTAAHDLRAPLRGITGFAQLLAADYGDRLDEMGRSMLERMRDSAGQMGQLLSDLLEYSRVSQRELRLEQVNLDGAVKEVLALLESDVRSKQAEVQVEGLLPEVMAHPATLVMLISNLVCNGLKFVPQGVSPQLRIWAQPMPALEGAKLSKPSGECGCVRVWVEDNGIGIAPENLGRVFGTFQRLQGKNAYPGTGLGLAIVRKGAERMGGRTGVESEVGKGSRFWLELKAGG